MNVPVDSVVSEACRRHCDALGIDGVRRRLLLDEDGLPREWRGEAALWLEERLRRQGEWALRGVLLGIALLCAAIAATVAWLW